MPDQLATWLESIRGEGKYCFRETLKVIAPTKCGEQQPHRCMCTGKAIKSGETCPSEINELTHAVVEILGGATVYNANGWWLNNEGNLVFEPVKVIESAKNCIDSDQALKLTQAINRYGKNMNQYSVSISNGGFHITPTAKMTEAIERLKKRVRGKQTMLGEN